MQLWSKGDEVQITNVVVKVVQPEEWVFQWKEEIPPRRMSLTALRIDTDEGVSGEATAWLPGPAREVADTVAEYIRSVLIGRSVNDREAIWHEMMAFSHSTISPKAASTTDIALWDLAGKQAGLPVYQLLGAYRHSIRAYASTVSYPNVQDYVDVALECQRLGFTAFKTHAFGLPDEDLEVCRAVREAVGPGVDLMHDPVNAYNFIDALRVGRGLQELDFTWYEAPIRDEDIHGYVQLCQALDIPIAGAESLIRGIWDFARYLEHQAVDIVRCIGDAMGGITAMRKVGALCEAYNRRMEPHSYGSTSVQAAHLHYMLSARNCEYFEMPYPVGVLDFGMKSGIVLNPDGTVSAPTAPGLGFDVDWDVIDDGTVYEA